jgi:DNA (cytosine-5)-methyltransferase 1
MQNSIQSLLPRRPLFRKGARDPQLCLLELDVDTTLPKLALQGMFHTGSSMTNPNKRRSPTVIDLFAGCGGLSQGLELAGFRPLMFSELNKDAADTYLANRRHLEIASFGDVKQLTNDFLDAAVSAWKVSGVPEVDLVCGGPPCQGFSGIGIRRTFKLDKEEIPSNHLFKEMVRVIEKVQPRMFLFENVKGLMTGRWTPDGTKGEIWRDVLAAFQSIEGYEARPALIQAKQFGIPQNRPRVLIVGIRNDLGWRPDLNLLAEGLLPEPNGNAPDPIDIFSDLVDERYPFVGQTSTYLREPQSEFQLSVRTSDGHVLRKGSVLTDQEYSHHSKAISEKFSFMLRNGGVIPDEMKTKKFAQRLIPEAWPPTGPNITATSLPDDYVHYCQPRTLTVREWARLQTFPDSYVFKGPRTTGGRRRAGDPSAGLWDRDVPKYTQIGNAVPVELARQIGNHLRQFLI